MRRGATLQEGITGIVDTTGPSANNMARVPLRRHRGTPLARVPLVRVGSGANTAGIRDEARQLRDSTAFGQKITRRAGRISSTSKPILESAAFGQKLRFPGLCRASGQGAFGRGGRAPMHKHGHTISPPRHHAFVCNQLSQLALNTFSTSLNTFHHFVQPFSAFQQFLSVHRYWP